VTGMSAIRCDVGVSGTALSELLIEGVLNARSRNMVQHVFSSQYVDHNPVPGLAYGLGGIHQLLQFLSHDDVDIVFTLERSVSDTDSVYPFRSLADPVPVPSVAAATV
jgi:hypothetical protein